MNKRLTHNPIQLGNTRYSVKLRNAKGKFVEKLAKADYFVLYYKSRVVSSAKFPRGNMAVKRSVLEQYIEHHNKKVVLAATKKRLRQVREDILVVRSKQVSIKGKKKKVYLARLAKDEKKYKAAIEVLTLDTQLDPMASLASVKCRAYDKNVFSQTHKRDLELKRFDFTHPEVNVDLPSLKASLKQMAPLYIKEVRDVIAKLNFKDEKRFLFRVLYSHETVDGNVLIKGAGASSHGISGDDPTGAGWIVEESLKHMEDRLYSSHSSYYASKLIPHNIKLVGFTVECAYKQGRVLKSKRLLDRIKLWKKQKKEFTERRESSRYETRRDRAMRLALERKEKAARELARRQKQVHTLAEQIRHEKSIMGYRPKKKAAKKKKNKKKATKRKR